ncbi:kinesin-like protein KIF16B [Watersipora subatra]|uniref:kinesin-like protein KIF16B n=1 Tax=Watersipora subatra TaxID=2589382 RepID=UPI00355C1AB6
MGVIVDSPLPHLEGTTTVGKECASRKCDIALHGPGIAAEHCIIKHSDGSVCLYPRSHASCAINGSDITEPTRLTQGDVILLGKTNMFRFNNPSEAAKLRIKRKSLNDISMERRSSSNLEMFFKSPMSRASSSNSLLSGRTEQDSPRLLQRSASAQ